MENAEIAGRSDDLTLSNIFAVVNIFSLPVYPHPDVEPGVGPVRDLEDHGARQQVQRHRGDLRHVPVTWTRRQETRGHKSICHSLSSTGQK